MKRLLLAATLLLAALLARPAAAQDLLTRRDGTEVLVKVLEITPELVKYRRFDNPDGPLISVRKADVFRLKYANGTRAVLTPAPPTPAPDTAQSPLLGLSAGQRRQRGAQDARRYYHQSGPFWGAFASAILVTPIYGVVPTTCISLKHVAARNLMAPQPARAAARPGVCQRLPAPGQPPQSRPHLGGLRRGVGGLTDLFRGGDYWADEWALSAQPRPALPRTSSTIHPFTFSDFHAWTLTTITSTTTPSCARAATGTKSKAQPSRSGASSPTMT